MVVNPMPLVPRPLPYIAKKWGVPRQYRHRVMANKICFLIRPIREFRHISPVGRALWNKHRRRGGKAKKRSEHGLGGERGKRSTPVMGRRGVASGATGGHRVGGVRGAAKCFDFNQRQKMGGWTETIRFIS